MNKKTVVPLKDIVRIARKIELRLNSLKQGRRNTNDLIEIRTGLNVLLSALISILHKDDILQTKADIEVFKLFESDFGRLIKILDERQEVLDSMIGKERGQMNIMLNSKALAYISEMESVLFGSIYFPLKRALDRNPKTPRDFFYDFYEILNVNVSLFGAETRLKGKAMGKTDAPHLSAGTLKSAEGQKKLEKDFDSNFKGYENLIMGQKVFENV